MAKVFKSNLPKVISKANREISTIIENDIIAESKLLKELVDQVLSSNLEVKKKNNQRITEAKRKLTELDENINDLTNKIDLVDRETVIQQLNEMIDAENNIFAARQEIRFFDNKKTPERLDSLDSIYNELIDSIQKVNKYEESFREGLLHSNELLFNKQIDFTKEAIRIMDELFDAKKQYVFDELEKHRELIMRIESMETDFSTFIDTNLQSCLLLSEVSTSVFTDIDDDTYINEKLQIDHENTLVEINNNLDFIKEKFEAKKAEIDQSYLDYEASVNAKLELNNTQLLDQERQQQDLIEKKLKDIRFSILDAEKNNNISQVQKLMKQFEKVEKSKSLEVTKKVSKEASSITKKVKIKTLNQLQAIELKYVSDLNKNEHSLILENIKYEEAKILFKIKSDFAALQGDVDINKQRLANLKEFLDTKLKTTKELNGLKVTLRQAELQMLKENELLEQSLITSFKELLLQLKQVDNSRIIALKENVNNHSIIKTEQEFQVKKSIELIKLDQELMDIDKLILKKRNETLIKNEKIKEEANSEIIYQESRINIAKKEHELQLIKVKSLYENERTLAEEQIERIHLGVKVNDAFVKTTLENQLLFASQQIKCAESEYEIRVESINLTHGQELEYADKKINYYRQKYEYEKSKIVKDLEDKLEDLNYKLLLFTDEKDNKEINKKIEKLKGTYNGMIQEIEKVENEDIEISRYEKVIQDADNRAHEAIEEALNLKNQTVDSFDVLYNQTKQKYDLIKENDQTEDTKGIMPVLNNTAVSSANDRLQKAIKEANVLYRDKIESPTHLISDTKKMLESLISSKEANEFVDEQKELKKHVIKEHKDLINALEEEKERLLLIVEDELQKVKEANQMELKDLETNIFTDAIYRNENDIENDYSDLFKKETVIYKEYTKEVSDFRDQRLIEHTKIAKETYLMIKQTFKPYKKYIRFASKGLNSKKKDLAKEFSKKLSKSKNEVLSSYRKQLSNI